jgi:hypothetical protein
MKEEQENHFVLTLWQSTLGQVQTTFEQSLKVSNIKIDVDHNIKKQAS